MLLDWNRYLWEDEASRSTVQVVHLTASTAWSVGFITDPTYMRDLVQNPHLRVVSVTRSTPMRVLAQNPHLSAGSVTGAASYAVSVLDPTYHAAPVTDPIY